MACGGGPGRRSSARAPFVLDDLEDPGLIDLHLPQSDLDLRYALAKIRNLVTILPDLGAELPDLAAKNPDVRTESGDIRTKNAHVRMNNAHLRMKNVQVIANVHDLGSDVPHQQEQRSVLFETAHCMPAISTPVAVNTTATIAATSRRGNRAQTARPFAAASSERAAIPAPLPVRLLAPRSRSPPSEPPSCPRRGNHTARRTRIPSARTVAPNSHGRRSRSRSRRGERRIPMTNEADAYGEGGDGEEPAAARGYALAQASAIATRVANQTPSRPLA